MRRAMPRPVRLALALFLASGAGAAAEDSAAVDGDIGHGRDLARQWCATCHDDPNSSAPRFAVLNHSGLSDAEIARRIRGHSTVKPGFNFSDREMTDFLAWLRTQTSLPRRAP